MSSARELHVGVPTLNPWLPGSKRGFPRLRGERNAFRLQRAIVISIPTLTALPSRFSLPPVPSYTGDGT